jgi:hypothetical protein
MCRTRFKGSNGLKWVESDRGFRPREGSRRYWPYDNYACRLLTRVYLRFALAFLPGLCSAVCGHSLDPTVNPVRYWAGERGERTIQQMSSE